MQSALTGATRLNPVRLPQGLQTQTEAELTLPGSLPLTIERAYSPRFAAPTPAQMPLGPGHLTNLDLTITDGSEPETYAVMTLDGTAVTFDKPPAQLFSRSYNDGFRHLSLEPLSRAGLKLNDRKISYSYKRYRGRVWRIVAIEDLCGNRTVFHRDAAGLLEEIELADGLRLSFHNRADGLRAGYDILGLDGQVIEGPTYGYDAEGRLNSVDHPFGPSWVYAWDAEGRRSHADDGGQTRTAHHYDDQGRVTEVNPKGHLKRGRIDYAASGKQVTVTHGAEGTEFEKVWFDEIGRQFMHSDAEGHFSYRAFNDRHDIIATVDPNGGRRTQDFDAFGNLQSSTDPEGREVFVVWDEFAQPVSITTPGGETEEFTYDARGLLEQHQGAGGHITNFRHNDAGHMTQMMRHDGLIEFRRYDAHNRLVELIDTGSGKTTFEYDGFHRLIASTDPEGGRMEFAYGAGSFLQPTRITRPDGVTIERCFGRDGRLASVTDGEGRTEAYEYGAYGVLEAIIDAKGDRLTFAYDSRERLVSVTNQLGLKWEFERNARGLIIRETDFDGRTLRYAHDPAGRMIRREAPDGSWVEFDHDLSGLLIETRAFADKDAAPLVTTYAYDENGALAEAVNADATLRFERDARGLVTAETRNGVRIESSYDCCGQRTGRTIGHQVLTLGYDGRGGLASWELEGHAPLTFTRNGLGQETGRETSRGFALSQGWDAAGQLIAQTASGTVDRRYDWTRAAEPQRIADGRWGETVYDYDANGQVTRARHGDGGEERFSYSADRLVAGSGDLTQFTDWTTSAAGVVHMARGPRGEMVALDYDANGRVIRRTVTRNGFRTRVWRFDWNALDQMVAAHCPDGTTWRYAYDPLGRRISKTSGVQSHDYLWDGDVIARETVNGHPVDWFFEPGSFRPLARLERGELAHVVTDHLGTPKDIISDRGALLWAADHDIWGSLRVKQMSAGTETDYWQSLGADVDPDLSLWHPDATFCPIRFPGQWEDNETGSYYNRARYFEPLTSSYSSPDPIGLLGGVNPHGYVANPLTYADPFGLKAWSPMGSGICIVQKFPPGSPAAEELADFVGMWNNEIIARGGSMTAGPLTALQEQISRRWKQNFRNTRCCAPNEVAGHVPDAAAGGLPNPSNGGLLQRADTNSYLGGITGDMARRGQTYTWVHLRDKC